MGRKISGGFARLPRKIFGGRIGEGRRNGGPHGVFFRPKRPAGKKRAMTRKNKIDTRDVPSQKTRFWGSGDPPTDGREIPQNVKSENENKLHREIYLVEAYLVGRTAPPHHTAPPCAAPRPVP